MGGIKLKIHPLFYIFGLYYVVTGKIFAFFVCTVTAIIHELGHSVVAGERGYRLNKITLMSFGAVVSGNFDHPNLKDEIAIALAGPLLNLAIALFFVAFWWIYPQSYPYTQSATQANLSMAMVNLIPAYPLDGGRVLSAFLSIKLGRKKSNVICRNLGVTFSILLLALFVFGCVKKEVNLSLGFFSLFILFGALNREKDLGYVKVYVGVSVKRLKQGVKIERHAIEKSATVKRLLNILETDAINEVTVYDNYKPVYTFSQDKIKRIIERAQFSDKIEKYLPF